MTAFEIGDDRLGQDADAFYATLMKAHDGLDETQSHALNARLVLIMGNHIGDLSVLEAIIAKAITDV